MNHNDETIDEQSMKAMGLPLSFSTPNANRTIPTGPSNSSFVGRGGRGRGGQRGGNNYRGGGRGQRGFHQNSNKNEGSNRNHPYNQRSSHHTNKQNSNYTSNQSTTHKPSVVLPIIRPSFTDPNPWRHLE